MDWETLAGYQGVLVCAKMPQTRLALGPSNVRKLLHLYLCCSLTADACTQMMLGTTLLQKPSHAILQLGTILAVIWKALPIYTGCLDL